MKLTTDSHKHDGRQIRPIQAVLHPAWLLAVIVLVVNDHMLKPSEFSGVLTGKLSDFAGLFFFPVLLAAIFGVRSKRGLYLSGAATALVFSAINLSPALAAGFDALISTVVGFVTTPDPTDLVALVAIPAGIATFLPFMRPQPAPRVRRTAELFALLVGATASSATSPPCDEVCQGQVAPNQSSQVSILNKTNELQVLRIRTLRDDIAFDCETVEQDPNLYLRNSLFGPPQIWWVQSGQEIPVNTIGQRNCEVALVQSDTAPEIVLFFYPDEMAWRSYAFDADIPYEVPADDQTVVLDADYSRADQTMMHSWRERGECGERADLCNEEFLAPLAEVPAGTRYFWRSQYETDLHFPRASRSSEGTVAAGPEECSLDTRGDAIVWEDPFSSEVYVREVVEGRDGCHEIVYSNFPEGETSGWWVCAPFEGLQMLAEAPEGTRLSMTEHLNYFGDAIPGAGYEALEMTVLQNDDSGASLNQIWLVRGHQPPPEVDFEPVYAPVEGCNIQEIECGQVAVASRVSSEVYDFDLAPGESASAGEVLPIEVFLVRAHEFLVTDASCGSEDRESLVGNASSGALGYMEAVIVRNDR